MDEDTKSDLDPIEQTKLSEQTAPNRSPVGHDEDRNADQRNRANRHDERARQRSGFRGDEGKPPAVTGESPAAPGPPTGETNS